ncbi:exosortase O [Chamaesiphon sp. OTE_75_metabat_556]|uniref:exosortase O n=1 Tax=Chamaesiphon sp. OTE_75_metabat_556 TaxID=2964692 RepID=UPI00286BA90C|nr:exosortase O [Chamaesiphon sp. OTE_75_metabat_556]
MTNIPLLHRASRLDRGLIAGTIAIVASWLYFNHVPLQWLATSIFDVSPFNAVILVAGALLLAFLGWRYRQSIELAPGLHRLPLIVMLGCGIGSMATQWLVSLTQLPVGLFLLGSYGLLGLWLAPSVWRRGLPVGIAIACLLPFGVQFSVGVGAPARILTAHIVEWILHQWQISAISAGDVIVLNTGVAYVDLPCSGLKSMWTGTLFLLAATWLEGRQIGLRWLFVGLANLGFLAIANTGRVLILTILIHVLHQPAWAEILHVPMGLIGFVTASLLTWLLLRFVPNRAAQSATSERIDRVATVLNWRSLVALSGLLLVLAIVPMPQPERAISAIDLSNLQWVAPMQTQTLDLNPQERKFFASYPGVTTRKQQFQYGDLTGTSVVVASPTWQAHHAPEICLAASGYKIAPVVQRVITPEVTARWLSLDDGNRSAIYWFQSATRTTDDFMSRFWDDVFRRESRWTMVSVVFDRADAPDTPTVQAFIKQTHDAIDRMN